MLFSFTIGGQTCQYETGTDIARETISGSSNSYFITGKNIESKYGKVLGLPKESTLIIDDGESAKSLESYGRVMSWLMENGAGRNSTLAYIGGGTVGDLAGFVASTFKRGMNLVAIPTTFLSMIDSSIGGKNGINLNGVKNMAGTFLNPSRIVADTSFIKDNTPLIMAGLPEAIKHGFIKDRWIIDKLDKNNFEDPGFLEEFIIHNARIKAEICSLDPYDTLGTRSLLNFGHTVGHWIESSSKNRINHGEAVMMGMFMESTVTSAMGLTENTVPEKIRLLGEKLGIPTKIPDSIIVTDLTHMEYDKKINGDDIYLPVVTSPGNSKIVRMKLKDLKSQIEKAMVG